MEGRWRRRQNFHDRGACYDIGHHLVRVWEVDAAWAASVDGLQVQAQYRSAAAAWEAGVAQAERLDRFAAAGS
jgi:hypothetical protein